MEDAAGNKQALDEKGRTLTKGLRGGSKTHDGPAASSAGGVVVDHTSAGVTVSHVSRSDPKPEHAAANHHGKPQHAHDKNGKPQPIPCPSTSSGP